MLLALDLSEASVSAIRAAESLVLTPDVDATIVHAHKPPYQGMLHTRTSGWIRLARYADDWKREANNAVRDLLKYESANFARYDIHIEQQPAAAGHSAGDRALLARSTRDGNSRRRAPASGFGRQRRQSGSSRDSLRCAYRAGGLLRRLAQQARVRRSSPA